MRRFLVSLPLLLGGAVAFAQAPSPHVGVFGGMNQARIEGNSFDISNHAGAAVGAYVNWPLRAGWSFQTGASWTQKGWERDEPGTRDLAVAELTYVEVPLLLRFDVAFEDWLGVLIFAGPGLGFQTGCSLSSREGSTGQTATGTCADVERVNAGLEFKSFDVGGILGAGAHVGIGRARVVATGQYEVGFKSIESPRTNKNRVATVGLGLEFPFGR